jgi:taurine dioxygenase
LLHALEVPPEGGQTGFADTAGIYDALPDDLVRRIEGLRVVHGFGAIGRENRAALESPTDGKAPEFPDVIHPLVHRHPESGRRVLNISPNFSRSIVGLPPEEGDALLEQLRDFATQDRFVYFHEWRVGDLVIWDNWRTQHTASGHKKKYARRMHRTTLRGGGLSGVAAVSGR